MAAAIRPKASMVFVSARIEKGSSAISQPPYHNKYIVQYYHNERAAVYPHVPVLQPFEFIPIKSWVARGAGAPGNCAVRNRAPSRDRGRPPSTGGSGPSRCDTA